MSGENKSWTELSAEEAQQRLSFWIAELHRRSPDSIGDLLHFRVASCRPEAGEYCFRVSTEDWMKNAFGNLHGGIISTIVDQGMGMLATCMMGGKANTPTVQMNITYQHPLMPGDPVLLNIHVEAVTRTLLYLRSEVRSAEHPDKLCATASGVFYIKML